MGKDLIRLSFSLKKFITEILFFLTAFLFILLVIQKPVPVPVVEKEVPLPDMRYGIPVDSFRIETGLIRKNQNLSDLLLQYGISMASIDLIAKKSTLVFDVRKIKAGNPYSLFQNRDSRTGTRYFVYEADPVEYIVFELFDSLRIYKGRKEVETYVRTASGIITSSLWNAIKNRGLDPMLAIRLSEVYAWTIDFFDIKKGDRFRVVYDEQFVDSVSIGISTIHSAEFEHIGQPVLALRFFQDDRYDYFDAKGENLRKAFLKAPLVFSRISSRFSGSRFHPILKIRRPHYGVDYSAARGTPVVSIGDGDVIERGFSGGGGNTVKIRHNSIYTTVYMHLSGFGPGIKPGVRVQQGQVIGYVGSTGLSTGPHLDFRVYRGGSPIDPLKMEAPPVEPVKPENRQAFGAVKDSLIKELNKIRWEL